MQLFQIYYDERTRAGLDPAFTPLDNTQPEHPGLYEYGPIRQTLLTKPFKDDEYLGFFSPRFKDKTGMTGAEVVAQVEKSHADVISFSPHFALIALYPNSFMQGEVGHPELMRVAQQVMQVLDIPLNLVEMAQDQTRIIFCNYFVAKYRFWRQWLDLVERVLSLSENQDTLLARRLNAPTSYIRTAHEYPMKIFVLERMVSVLLEITRTDAEVGADFGRAPLALGSLTKPEEERLLGELMTLDALKGFAAKTHSVAYRKLYVSRRAEFVRALQAIAQPRMSARSR
ncbi:hypothetical protein [Ottowia sp.]|uniref:hypothetical protein n=1 Tax=Ottowia sp. TaxID=1898956 RepID=UPI0039E332E7